MDYLANIITYHSKQSFSYVLWSKLFYKIKKIN